ncbi:hypothetical protein B9G69_001345 [Bdellovibrio sp. SKB1291214]|uniref:hypothetical protein n=1 Tax=Bdellovibrio sp. SKB1291214 TaxID=1732569 RepID=UPI000B51DAB1|nr:hypothetical protein [Bdellovibrio sp. SKB1291214]UYL09220.1 hypothetical protein B9G69_001345 [Bdellovibrio sp. SKB1291214]
MINQIARKSVVVASAISMLAGCGKSGGTYSILADSDSYKQEAVYVPKKIDILWVIDNSGSMKTSQDNLAANFQSFIARFNQNNSDFHMAVGTTDAWEKQFNSSSEKARLRDGTGAVGSSTRSGVYVMDKNTPNLSQVFVTNVKQGINGNGDERAFESIKQILQDPFNAGFRRPDATLAIIIVSDEEDFSQSVSTFSESYTNNKLYPVQNYIDFLDTYTGGTANGRNYSVSNIAIQDTACRDQLKTDKFPTRYHDITNKTGGINGSLCSNFGATLELISDSIIQLSSSFKLSREPVPESIVVTVDGVTVAQDATNGWTYDAATLTITFHGSSVPNANSNVKINFDPKSIII